MKFKSAVWGCLGAVSLVWCFTGAASAATVTLTADLRGNYASDGVSSLVTNSSSYFAGYHSETGLIYRNWFGFDLAGVSGVVVGAQLVLSTAQYFSGEASETYGLYQVTTPASQLGSNSVSIFQDLGSGPAYGSATLGTANAYQTIAIDLGAAALNDLNTALGGRFALGGGLTSLNLSGANEAVFGNSTGGTNLSRLVLTTVPVPLPASALLLASGLLGLGAWRRRIRR